MFTCTTSFFISQTHSVYMWFASHHGWRVPTDTNQLGLGPPRPFGRRVSHTAPLTTHTHTPTGPPPTPYPHPGLFLE
eukprot:scaffold45312_cov298-Isochrysis_galbana.AAC.1